MRLNNDCIRDILLYIEEHTTDEYPFVSVSDLKSKLQKYSSDVINYHVRQIDQANLVNSVSYADDAPQDIAGLSWEGNIYISNIRDDKVWSKLKDATKHLASVSLPVLIEKAPDIVKHFIK
ncbi:DUF2513 domain-containing protein [Clostridium sp. JN-1]|uniref:DUF2513 domain-containing protein n=1 Tax=Clostridium sp. JN-1 TaxID=2483110 RepID=UPI000F0B2FA4|nr:DUF2513 domain-containing protein [Clostridium sp. JN-1]